jgi:hypothetical protein
MTIMMRKSSPTTSSSRGACSSWALFPFWCLDDKGGEESYLYPSFSFLVCNGLSCTYGGSIMDKYFYMWLVKF